MSLLRELMAVLMAAALMAAGFAGLKSGEAQPQASVCEEGCDPDGIGGYPDPHG